MEKFYCKLLAWSIMRLVNRQKTYHDRCDRLNRIVNWLLNVYSDYSTEEVVNYDNQNNVLHQ